MCILLAWCLVCVCEVPVLLFNFLIFYLVSNKMINTEKYIINMISDVSRSTNTHCNTGVLVCEGQINNQFV